MMDKIAVDLSWADAAATLYSHGGSRGLPRVIPTEYWIQHFHDLMNVVDKLHAWIKLDIGNRRFTSTPTVEAPATMYALTDGGRWVYRTMPDAAILEAVDVADLLTIMLDEMIAALDAQVDVRVPVEPLLNLEEWPSWSDDSSVAQNIMPTEEWSPLPVEVQGLNTEEICRIGEEDRSAQVIVCPGLLPGTREV